MHTKHLWGFGALLLLVAMAVYFYLHPSYRLSLEAKIYYTIGEYESAYEIAEQAYELNQYNRMAFTVMVQSKNAQKFLEFIEMAKEYYTQIQAIAAKEDVNNADKIKIKMLSEVVLQSHKRLNPTQLTDETLVKDAQKYKDNFQKLYDDLFLENPRR